MVSRRRSHDRIARLAAATTNAAAGFVALTDGDALRVSGSHGLAPDVAEALIAEYPLRFEEVRLTATTVVHRGPGAFAVAPLSIDGGVAGVVCVTDARAREFATRELEALGDMAGILATELLADRERELQLRRGRWERDQRAVLESIASGAPLRRTLDLLLEQIEAYSDELICSILLLDGRCLRHGSAPRLPEAYVAAIDGIEIGPAVGSCGTAMFRGEQVIVEDIATDPLWADYKELALAYGLRACWSTPILGADGAVLGSFAIYYREPRRPDPADLDLVAQVSNLASIALMRDRHEAALRRSARAAAAAAAEQAALRRVATAVAEDRPAEEIFALVAAEAGKLSGADTAGVEHYVDDRHAQLCGAWAGEGAEPPPPVGETRALAELPVALAVREAQAAVHLVANRGEERPFALGAPVREGDRIWGLIGITRRDAGFDEEDRRRLCALAELVSTSIASAAMHEHLAALAATDPLTGLANHRVFQERLRGAVANAARHGDNVALALFDLDGFKAVNDGWGHQEGDRVLQSVGRVLREQAREGDVVARLGGDEFALLMPGSDSYEAATAAERIRELVAAADPGAGEHHLTLSAGTCDLVAAADADELLHHADTALYSAKAHGRDLATIYTPTTADGLTARERAARLAQSRTRMGIRALARAIDARDPLTLRHSERVAVLAARLAQAAGWPAERVVLLREAALIHDVGKIAVPDEILRKPGRLTEPEMEVVRGHAALGAQIADDVLTKEQTGWIRSHHERPDGEGYPDGLTEEQLTEGVQLLAIADAWDAMRSPRSYRVAREADAAFAECRALAGRQFTPWAVELLGRVHGDGGLPGGG